jgi:hypothetical protein
MQSECVYGAKHRSAAVWTPYSVESRFLVFRLHFHGLFPRTQIRFEKKLLDGNVRPGTLGAPPIELLAHVSQVGFEPTSSRVSGEVTLVSTTSNLVASRHYFRREQTP